MAEGPWPDESASARVRAMRSAQLSQQERRLDLQEVLSVLWYRKWSILAITVLTVAVALLVSSQQTPIYVSQAGVLVTPIDTGADAVTPEAPNLATEAELISSVAVAEIVADNLGIEGDPRDLLASLEVDQPTDTEILEVSYRDPNPVRARRLATGFADGYLQFREEAASKLILEQAKDLEAQIQALEQRLRTVQEDLARLPSDDPRSVSLQTEAASLQNLILQTQIARLNLPTDVTGGEVIQPASVAGSPVSPDYRVNVAFGLAAGLALGIGLALIRDRMSGRLRSSDEVEEYLEAPVLGVVPRVPDWRRRKSAYLVTTARWRSPAAEAYRVIRTNVLWTASNGAKSIVVTSTHSGEGKSATVANLAVVLARAGKRVSIVSADLRRPRLHEFFRRDGHGRSQRRAGRQAALGCRRSGGRPSVVGPHGSVDRVAPARLERPRAGGSGRAPGIAGHGEGHRGPRAGLGHRADRCAPGLAGDGCPRRCHRGEERASRDRTEQRDTSIRRIGQAATRAGGSSDPRWCPEWPQRHQGAILRLLLIHRTRCRSIRAAGAIRSQWPVQARH